MRGKSRGFASILAGCFLTLSLAPAGVRAEGQPAVQPGGEAEASAPSGSAAPAVATEKAASATDEAEAPPADDRRLLLRQADTLYRERGIRPGSEKLKQLIQLLESGLKRYTGDYDLMWRLARAYWWKADGLPNGEEKAKYGKKAMQYGDWARVKSPKTVEGHYYAALGVGAYSQAIGILSALTKGLEGKFNERLDKALAIDAKYECAGPMVTKGRYYFELPWPKYDGEKAIEWYQKAVAACPKSVRGWAYLAEVLEKEGEEARAKEALSRALAIDPKTAPDPAEARRGREYARKLQERWNE